MKASLAITKFLERLEVDYCFELIGGMITHLIDSMAQSSRINVVSMHHEQAAAFAAEGYGRACRNGRIAVALGTSGPGATNLITGIGSCWFDSVPCLFITGQVNTHEQRGALSVRQQGFQELDIVSMVEGVTKYAVKLDSAERILPELHKAVSMALSGRQGPVLIDLPNDLQREMIDDSQVEYWLSKPLDVAAVPVERREYEAWATRLLESKRPLVCFGGGAIGSRLLPEVITFLSERGIPYVGTLMGMERLPHTQNYMGMIGTYGNRAANIAVQQADHLLVLGSRLDVRQTGADVTDFARNAFITQVDIDPSQLNNRIAVDQAICGSVDAFFEYLLSTDLPQFRSDWVQYLERTRTASLVDEYADLPFSPFQILQFISAELKDIPCHYVMDVGNNQMWGATCLTLHADQYMHHSGGMGAMGFSLPAALGIALGSGTKAVSINGDGGLQINLQELDTLARLKLDVKVIVFNNGCLGMVKNFQDMYFEGRNQSTFIGYSVPDFVQLGKAFGLNSIRIESPDQMNKDLAEVLKTPGPALIEFMVPGATDCRPRLTYGYKLDEQQPAMELERAIAGQSRLEN